MVTVSSCSRSRLGVTERVVLVKLGFFTACLAQSDLESIAQRAAAAGFSVLEAAAWPAQSRDHTAAHVDVRAIGPAEAEAIQKEALAVLDTAPLHSAIQDAEKAVQR